MSDQERTMVPTPVSDAAVATRLYGHDVLVWASSIESDGRKRSAAVKRLVDLGLLKPKKPTDRGDKDMYHATDRAYDAIETLKPDLVERFHVDQLSDYVLEEMARGSSQARVPAVVFADLSCTERKWIIEHPADYRLAAVDSYNHGKWVPVAVGNINVHQMTLYVTDDALTAAIADAIRAWRIRRAFKTALPWGLENVLALPEAAADRFRVESTSVFGHGRTVHLGTDTSKWAERVQDALKRAREELTEATAFLCMLTDVESVVARFGGWEKFAAEYQQAIVRAIDKDEDKDGEGGK